MSEPKPVAWMVESKFGLSVHLHEQQARAEAAFPGSRITPLYPGPFRVQFGVQYPDDSTMAGVVNPQPLRMGKPNEIPKGCTRMRRLVSEWERDRDVPEPDRG